MAENAQTSVTGYVQELEAKNAELEVKNAQLDVKTAELAGKNAELEREVQDLDATLHAALHKILEATGLGVDIAKDWADRYEQSREAFRLFYGEVERLHPNIDTELWAQRANDRRAREQTSDRAS